SLHLWPWVLVAGLAGLGTHYCFARAFQLADAGIVAPIDFVRLPAAAVIGYLAYDEAIDVFVYLGAAVIFTGNALNILGSRRAGG
ncbi:MAG: EamA family transporter, partial [Alphaproteobacteria bacterium]|nr:EamA family transporter [Alphaproteobacteria bacterium]